MKKKRNLIGVCLVAVLMLALTVIGYAAGDGEAAPEYGAWCLVPPLVTIVLAFVTKQTIISMFIGIWVGATIIHHFNPIDGLIGSFTGYLVPSIADSWNAGMLIIMALIGGFMYMLSACGGAEVFGRWAEKVANNRKKSQLLAWIAPFVFIFNQGCLLVGVIMRPVTDKTHISRVKLAYITDAMGAPLVSMSPISDNGVYLVGLLAACNVKRGATNHLCSNLTRVEVPEDPDDVVGAGKFILINDDDQVRVGVDVNSMTTVDGKNNTEDMKYIETVEAMDLMRDDIAKSYRTDYMGQYKNSTSNQMLFLAAVNEYFRQLGEEDVLDKEHDNKASVDVESQRNAWIGSGKSEAADWDDATVISTPFKRELFLGGDVKILGSMGSLHFVVTLM